MHLAEIVYPCPRPAGEATWDCLIPMLLGPGWGAVEVEQEAEEVQSPRAACVPTLLVARSSACGGADDADPPELQGMRVAQTLWRGVGRAERL